jgi:pimeloyl-ACP methyl ester carboxylesterase
VKLLGLADLLHDAVEKTSLLVQGAQDSAARRGYALLEELTPLAGAVHAVQDAMTAAVHSSIRGINDGVQVISRAALAGAETGAGPGLDRAQAALNGLYGDFLRQQQSGLEIEPGFYDRGEKLLIEREALRRSRPSATGKICILVHGLGCTEHEWIPPGGQDFGDRLGELGYTAYRFRYNTGLPVIENGRTLAALIEALVREHPVAVSEIALIGHSMGGLVARSAAHESQSALLRHVICLGSPHGGAPLEKAVHLLASALGSFEAAGAKVPAQVLEGRSAGIRDLRFGPEIPELKTATYCFVAACLTKDKDHPLGQILGDALVRIPSASGKTRGRRVSFHFGEVLSGLGHLDLQHHPKVYELLRVWLSPALNAHWAD